MMLFTKLVFDAQARIEGNEVFGFGSDTAPRLS